MILGAEPSGFIRMCGEVTAGEIELWRERFRTAQRGPAVVMKADPGDAATLRAAAAVLRRRAGRPNLVTAIFIRTLEKFAARVERSG